MSFTSSVHLHCFLSCLLESLTPFVPPHPRLHFLRTPGNKSKVMVGSGGNLEDNNGRFSSSSYCSYSSFFCLIFLSCVSKLFCFLEGNAELKLWLPPTQGHPAVAAPRVLLLHFPSSLLVTPQHTSTENLPLGYFYPHKPLFASLNSSTQWPHSYTHSYPSGLKQSDYFRMGFPRNILRQGLRVPRRTWEGKCRRETETRVLWPGYYCGDWASVSPGASGRVSIRPHRFPIWEERALRCWPTASHLPLAHPEVLTTGVFILSLTQSKASSYTELKAEGSVPQAHVRTSQHAKKAECQGM